MAKSISEARADFPILSTWINDHPLVYLDNAATTQKPQAVIDALRDYYTLVNSNVHRGNHTLAIRATDMYEEARAKVARFINAAHPHEVIFTRGTTESINLVAASFGEAFVHPGDEIIVSQLEHHSNFVPWFELCRRKGARFRVLPFTADGELDPEVLKGMFTEKTRLLALNQVSNSLGTVNPLETIIPLAHANGVPVLVDAAQSVQHLAARDVQALDADFYAFSGHKMYGPMGIGVLYAKEYWLEKMPPFLFGGEMIDQVSSVRVTFAQPPYKFEAGTPNVEGAVGLGAAVDYLNSFDWQELEAYEESLLVYGIEQLRAIPGLTLYGNPRRRSSILPFNVEGIQHYDMGILLDTSGVAVRTGQHCTQPIMDALSITGTVRASLALYNNREDIDALTHGIRRVIKMLKR
ncbi:MAG: cysteine desulfurase [Chloroflexi bacterium]|jgi:cysteine desulfurase/selenocysteine lyase|nr:cysteine desulfurase [Anaerolineaceae bacterium]NLI45131.1 cysteine desulfurase [Chloroflexota bacterium]HOE34337.1 cysteine desulfurase [Anaerolineaceae bacterium]HOT25618.1 cysteine desulfurase [Anaerolineaceae bacterium]HQH57252.1 cysteine desulfurase [Anaerolineaceae bacterium]